MSFAQSKGERLAEHLRECIHRGEIVEPIPGTLSWSRRLGVARMTLIQALDILQREGLVTKHPRGVRLNHSKIGRLTNIVHSARVVRMLHYTHDYPSLQAMDWVFPLSERLRENGVQLQVEPCDDVRVRAIARQKKQAHELFFLLSLAPRHQRLFSRSGKAAIVLGNPAKGISLLADGVDQIGAVGHATRLLMRKGFRHINLLIARLSGPGIKESINAFETAREEWPHQPIRGQIVFTSLSEGEDVLAARRFASHVQGKQGLVIVGPVQPSLIMMALLERGIPIPGQVAVVAVLPPFPNVRLCPPIPFYRMHNLRFIKKMANIAEHYFESGELPRKTEKFLLELVQGGTV